MANLSEGLYQADAWFDPIYQTSKKKKGKAVWNEVPDNGRFDHIVNSAFAIKSVHSSLIQVADAVSYVYRRHLELKREKEAWAGEQAYFKKLVARLEKKREGLGRNPGGPCIEFYQAARHMGALMSETPKLPRNAAHWNLSKYRAEPSTPAAMSGQVLLREPGVVFVNARLDHPSDNKQDSAY